MVMRQRPINYNYLLTSATELLGEDRYCLGMTVAALQYSRWPSATFR